MIKNFRILVVIKILFISVFILSVFGCKKSAEECYLLSLHATTDGMRYWHDAKGGLKDITNIPYDDLSCKNCHAKTCDKCHKKKNKDGKYTSEGMKDKELCLKCHSRAKVTFKIDCSKDTLDRHIKKGKVCIDCHKKEDIHGDCKKYTSMRHPGAVKASCENCHKDITKTKSHTVHGKKLHCNACHVSGSMTCYNCHFSKFLETGKKKGNFIPGEKKWLMLVNYEGQVTSGTVQTVVYKDKKFIAYAPYFTHSVMSDARKCDCCHSNPALKLIEKGQKVPVVKFENNKLVEWNGVFPYATDKLQWVFLDKVNGKWVELKNDNPVHVQNVGLAEPLTDKQIKSLIKSYK